MIQDINFLPVKYRQMRLSRQQKVWRRGILAVFLALVVAGVAGQRQTRSHLTQTRNNLRADADRLTSQLLDPQQLRDEVTRLDGQANVLACLRLRVPPTRILSAVTNTLPGFVNLTDFDMKFEPLPAAPVAPGKQPAPSDQPTAAVEQLAAVKDLTTLLKERDENALFVNLGGIAPDDIAIAAYLASLQKTGVFADVTLLFTDQHAVETSNLRRFGVRLRVHKPGWQEVSSGETRPAEKSSLLVREGGRS